MLKTRILIADDHPVMRQGIRQLLVRQRDFEIVGEASDGEEAIRLADELVPDVIIMDVSMPVVGGLEATERIKAGHPAIAILIFTVHDEEEYILRLLEAGAAGYLLKSAYGDRLVQAIKSIRSGELSFDPQVGQKLLLRAASHKHKAKAVKVDGAEQLTTRETEVLQLASKGMRNKDIAAEMDVSVRTVKGHLVSIFAKLGVGSRTEAVLYAVRKGWIHS